MWYNVFKELDNKRLFPVYVGFMEKVMKKRIEIKENVPQPVLDARQKKYEEDMRKNPGFERSEFFKALAEQVGWNKSMKLMEACQHVPNDELAKMFVESYKEVNAL